MQKRSFLFFLCIAVLIASVASPARAEELDDGTIRQIYGEIKGAVRNPERLAQLLGERLDDNYVLKSNITRIIGTSQPQQLSGSMMKRQFIQDTVKNMSSTKMQDYQSTINSIQLSEDGKYATVNDTSTTSGTLDIPAQGGTLTDVKYQGKETCSHIVTLVNGVVKIMQSQCDDQINLNK